MVTAYSVKAKLLGLIAKANEATGNEDTDLTAAVGALIAGLGTSKLFQSPDGRLYLEHMNIVVGAAAKALNTSYLYSGCSEMKSIIMDGVEVAGHTSMFLGCSDLVTAELRNFKSIGTNTFRQCTSLESVQIGSVGVPVTSIGAYSFYEDVPATVITIYVADDESLPLANSPWGNSKATIIYRSATTGEVIEV